MAKISYEEFRAKLMDPAVPDREIARYLKAVPADSGPFDPAIKPNPAAVELGPEERFEVESAMNWANGVARWRREQAFRQRIKTEKLPVLVSEGDSWFQFPFLLADVIDQLGTDHLIWSLDAAGDTAQNMVYGDAEYMKGLLRMKERKVRAFLFSAAGNDVIGEDELGNPVLATLLKPYKKGQGAAWHIDQARLSKVLQFLEQAYRSVVATVRKDADFAKLPIIIHGYDYAIPGGFDGDKRDPAWAKQDKWLGSAMRAKKIVDVDLQRDIIRILIDALYDMLLRVAGDSSKTFVHVADVRNTLKLPDWADEIHPTDAGFKKVAKVFRATLAKAGV
ncbi:hypothetical protein LJR090_002484 [Bosea sp. LjRoot90]|uniref:hypothetical protein n=1 Tax=Bosea sp. LjRoot90 TaxID=3342342 RepID=UPI003ECFE823